MKVILLQDVAKIGRRFEVTEVPDGYALNMLLPKGMAEAATPENLKRLKARTDKMEAAGAATADQFKATVEKIGENKLTISAELNEQGHMFEALKPAAVVAAAADLGATLTESQVVLANSIKEAGEHQVELTEGEESATITIEVVAK